MLDFSNICVIWFHFVWDFYRNDCLRVLDISFNDDKKIKLVSQISEWNVFWFQKDDDKNTENHTNTLLCMHTHSHTHTLACSPSLPSAAALQHWKDFGRRRRRLLCWKDTWEAACGCSHSALSGWGWDRGQLRLGGVQRQKQNVSPVDVYMWTFGLCTEAG